MFSKILLKPFRTKSLKGFVDKVLLYITLVRIPDSLVVYSF